MELIYRYTGKEYPDDSGHTILPLTVNDLDIFNQHLALCGQSGLTDDEWKEVYADGTEYFVLLIDGLPIARACIERYSPTAWETADVRVAKQYRNRGIGLAITRHVTNIIRKSGRTATIRTEQDNLPMRSIIEKSGFEQIF